MSKRRKYDTNSNTKPVYIKELKPQTYAQQHYLTTLSESTITFAHGSAGTGKTFIAAWHALDLLLKGEISKILLTRPIVATEDLGFLPGTIDEKVHPYLLPLFDSIECHIGPTKMKALFEDGKIEIAPLAYMRGRTLSNAYLIADEMQNSTKDQMRMLLTRIGYDTTYAITGDSSQSDLYQSSDNENGLAWAIKKLTGKNPAINVVEFKKTDIVRNPLIEHILTHLDS
jgi:phosphate starvation-inducible PhoH-like protein